MTQFPSTLICYKRTDEYTEETMPGGLKSSHELKGDVWAVIRVLEGELIYRTLGEGGSEIVLTPKIPGFVEPGTLHEVAPVGPVRFYIEFFKEPGGPEDGD